MTREELIEILKTGLDEQEIQDFNIGKLVIVDEERISLRTLD